jgi:undecaprenyl-diphosphatase
MLLQMFDLAARIGPGDNADRNSSLMSRDRRMVLSYVIFLAAVQGITEFLPISSSAHLILGRDLLAALGLPPAEGTAADMLAFDIALHIGTLGAVMLYFWRDVAEMVAGLFDGLTGRGGERFRLLLLVVVATVPVVVVGFLAKDAVTDLLRATEIIAWTTLIFALVLWAADRRPTIKHRPEKLTMTEAIFVGLMQCLALVPGVSRAGICMTAGRLAGFDRPLSARFSLLLAMPTTAAAGLLASYDLYRAGDTRLTSDAALGAALAFIFAFIAIALMMSWLRRATYTPFVVYRIALGLLLLGLIYGAGWSPVT